MVFGKGVVGKGVFGKGQQDVGVPSTIEAKHLVQLQAERKPDDQKRGAGFDVVELKCLLALPAIASRLAPRNRRSPR